ncbi:hypothetical protein V6Z70_18210, partial [Leptospira borgpetersenii]|uniref:hypothetical protein n=1 Tax=Leptospira borgpetersenii TaxID=174 RepID=UPI003B841E7C
YQSDQSSRMLFSNDLNYGGIQKICEKKLTAPDGAPYQNLSQNLYRNIHFEFFIKREFSPLLTVIDLRIGFIIVKLSWEFPHFRGFETGSDMAPHPEQ